MSAPSVVIGGPWQPNWIVKEQGRVQRWLCLLPLGAVLSPQGDYTKGLLMEQGLEKELQDIVSDLECGKDFICYKSGFETLGKTKEIKDIGLKGHFQCLEEDTELCLFSVVFANRSVCNCPLRIHIAKKLGK
jgi:hypothetical protein